MLHALLQSASILGLTTILCHYCRRKRNSEMGQRYGDWKLCCFTNRHSLGHTATERFITSTKNTTHAN
ncbi:hypothetical protein KC19_11G068700 [Ceratodon purpureus]|uniref:Secreted protein n=1 Tax=Ceratodon purpureus TaxID=3225 RepID=A0A8T0GFP2_CERPU|nr:hypothetical protein KC19_11G068700 [Ceratodon purpureus]